MHLLCENMREMLDFGSWGKRAGKKIAKAGWVAEKKTGEREAGKVLRGRNVTVAERSNL